ncbi:hypothetical protein ICA16_10585 [Pseudomonas anatoliensis]|uniref:hypothetical protein n=1 Tax=Pseudomonas anatoliensis TaxID=2710589 RepID=UPI001B3219C6|nr:hypothetical protein [Pseudomonas anatoliensis]MBP5956108.1 hypothetical protein [Pseudomonas anatoliensis]
MGTLLGGGSLLLGALPAQQKLNKQKSLKGSILPRKSLREVQTHTLKWQIIRYKDHSKPVTAFCHYFPLRSR